MEVNKTNMFGKTYNTIGSSESNFIIKTKGDLKIQWGNKFIDLIKNGKIVSSNTDFFKVVSSDNEITSNGIYIINDQDKSEVWININGNKINLTQPNDTIYVSFLKEQENSRDKKETALKNIGFYYDTLQEAQQEVTSGLIFIKELNKLYVVNNGILQEYGISYKMNFDSIQIGNISISESQISSKSQLSISLNNQSYILLSNNQITLNKSLILGKNQYIQSYGADANQGFRLYTDSSGSILEVDKVVERNKDLLSSKASTIYSTEENIVSSAQSDGDNVKCTLYYKNNFLKDQYIYIWIKEQYIITINLSQNRIEASLNVPASELIICRVYYNDDSQTDLTIDIGETSASIQLEDISKINKYEIVQGPENTCFSTEEVNFPAKLKEVQILESNGQDITFYLDSQYKTQYITDSPGQYVYLSNSNLIKIDKSNITLLQRDNLDDTIHTIIGEVQEDKIEQLKNCKVDDTYPDVGIFSDNFIGVYSKLYDVIFKKVCSYPKYDNTMEIPTEFNDTQYNKTVPNIEWVKKLLSYNIPDKSIIMFDGKSEIPEGWLLCDGKNGTPDLTSNFIKDTSGENIEGEEESYLAVYIIKQ